MEIIINSHFMRTKFLFYATGHTAQYGDKMSFLVGVDVQHLLPEGTVQEVREGIRKLIDTFYKPDGGLLLAAGNGIMPDTPLENIEAMLQEIALYRYSRG